jgi:hypothetical protein
MAPQKRFNHMQKNEVYVISSLQITLHSILFATVSILCVVNSVHISTEINYRLEWMSSPALSNLYKINDSTYYSMNSTDKIMWRAPLNKQYLYLYIPCMDVTQHFPGQQFSPLGSVSSQPCLVIRGSRTNKPPRVLSPYF